MTSAFDWGVTPFSAAPPNGLQVIDHQPASQSSGRYWQRMPGRWTAYRAPRPSATSRCGTARAHAGVVAPHGWAPPGAGAPAGSPQAFGPEGDRRVASLRAVEAAGVPQPRAAEGRG